MTGIVFQGGGIKGSYQIGAYFALKDNHIKINGFAGTSIGAFNACMLSAGLDEELLEFWMNLDPASLFGFEDEVSKGINENKFDFEFFDSTLKSLINTLSNKGIDINPLLETFDKIFDENKFRKSKKDFAMVTVRLNDAKPLFIYKDDIPKGMVGEYIVASCYLPVFKMEKLIDDNYYVDGGFYDACPTNLLLDRDYNKIYEIKIKGIGLSKKNVQNNAEIITIEPRRPNGSILELNKNIIQENIKMGYYDTIREIKHYDGYNYMFKRNSDLYYKLLTRKIDRREMRRIKNFFNVSSRRLAVIKSVEYIMNNKNMDYYKLYNLKKILLEIRLNQKEKHFVYEFVYKLHIL